MIVIIICDNSGIAQYKNRGSFIVVVLLVAAARLLRLERRKVQAKKKKGPQKNSCFMVPVGRSVGWAGFPSGE